ncbi:MAG: DUF5678 domain-containing protein [Patescibacteria group bacterium]
MEKNTIKIPDTSAITKNYVDKWVVLSQDYKKVIASGKTLSEVLKKTSSEERKVVFRVLPKLGYAPIAF